MRPGRVVLAALAAALIATSLVSGARAASAAAPTGPVVDVAAASWHCGSYCNYRNPYTFKLDYSDGTTFTCSQTRTLIASGHPRGTNAAGQWYTDTNMTVWLYYSSFCQTLWVEARNYKAIGRTNCGVWIGGAGSNAWPGENYACPSAGAAMNTPMFDDYCSTGCTWLGGELNEAVGGYYPSWYHAY
jgi:hypothetical protein